MIRGKGADRKGTRQDGLGLRWSWLRQCELSLMPEEDRRRLPCQVCFAKVDIGVAGTISFEAILWGSEQHGYCYEAVVEVNGDNLVGATDLPTRLDAQRRAEELLPEFCELATTKLFDAQRQRPRRAA